METDINLNQSRCVVDANGFTGTTVTNVCSGETYFVPYGAMDVVVGVTLSIIMAIVLSGASFFMYKSMTDTY